MPLWDFVAAAKTPLFPHVSGVLLSRRSPISPILPRSNITLEFLLLRTRPRRHQPPNTFAVSPALLSPPRMNVSSSAHAFRTNRWPIRTTFQCHTTLLLAVPYTQMLSVPTLLIRFLDTLRRLSPHRKRTHTASTTSSSSPSLQTTWPLQENRMQSLPWFSISNYDTAVPHTADILPLPYPPA